MRAIERRDFICLTAAGAAALAAGRWPTGAIGSEPGWQAPFSWDHVPVYGHLGKSEGDFTAEELDFLASRFPVVTIEKGQAVRQRGCTEEGIYEAARELKKRSPQMKVLFYWNTFINYPLYRAFERFDDAWLLRNRAGKPVLKGGTVPRPDLSLPEVRQWWSDVAAEAMRSAPLDGVFADALPQVLTPSLPKQVGEEKAADVVAGLKEMLALTRRKIGRDKIMLVNGLRATDYRQILDWDGVTGMIIEHFGAFHSGSPEDMRADLESLALAAERGKMAVLKGWPGFTWLDADMMRRPHAELLQTAREQITFPLACFLVAAQPQTYFCYSWGYRETHGMLDRYPEFERPLGAPKGPAVWKGMTATREFASAAVAVDLEKRTARVEW
ncbi:MAG: putative glycoside hydrolase [Planctomycetota bacterium]